MEKPWRDFHRALTHSGSCDVKWCERHIVPKATMTTVGYLGRLSMGVLTLPCPSARLMCWHLLRPLLCSRLPSVSFAWPHFSSNSLFGCQSSNLRPGHTLLFFFTLSKVCQVSSERLHSLALSRLMEADNVAFWLVLIRCSTSKKPSESISNVTAI